jgi:hypothetical protein
MSNEMYDLIYIIEFLINVAFKLIIVFLLLNAKLTILTYKREKNNGSF